MSQSESIEDLFFSMRSHFLEDPEDHLEKLKEQAALFAEHPVQVIESTLQICHNLKGSAQAVGFSNFGDVLHQVEDTLDLLKQSDFSEQLINVYDELFQQLIDDIDRYFNELCFLEEDSEQLGSSILTSLEKFKSLFPGQSPDQQSWGVFTEEEASTPTVVSSLEPSEEDQAWGFFSEDDVEESLEDQAVLASGESQAQDQAEDDRPNSSAAEAGQKSEASAKKFVKEAQHANVDDKYLLLEHGEQLLAIELSEVREIISHHQINPLPRPYPRLKGMIVVRDRALPVLDLAGLLGDKLSQKKAQESCAVICEKDSQAFAFFIERPRHVVTLNQKNFENINHKYSDQANNGLVKNVVKYGDESVLILDLKEFLDP